MAKRFDIKAILRNPKLREKLITGAVRFLKALEGR
jgi:hypothetical protein